MVDVADKDHRRVGVLFFLSPCKRSRRHVILHDLDSVLVLELDTRHFVKRHTIPHADQSDGFVAHVVKQIGYRCLTAGNQDAVRADLLVDMGLAGAARPQLAQVVVVLDQRDQPRQMQPLHPFVELGRLHAAAAQHQVDPFIVGEARPRVLHLVDIEPRHLDRRQVADDKRTAVLVRFIKEVFHLDDAPDTAAKQPFKVLDVLFRDRHILDAEIGELRLIDIGLEIKLDRDFVNHGIAAVFPQLGNDLLRFVRPHIIVGQNLLHIADSGLDFFFVT